MQSKSAPRGFIEAAHRLEESSDMIQAEAESTSEAEARGRVRRLLHTMPRRFRLSAESAIGAESEYGKGVKRTESNPG